MLNHLGEIGQAHGVEKICIGTELITMAASTEHSENTERWVSMINDLRGRYSGMLTYSANWGESGFPEELSKIGFWGHLDQIGVSAYYRLSGDGSVQSAMDNWGFWDANRIQPIAEQYGKPVVFTEVGYMSSNDAQNHPWDYNAQYGYNGEVQANLYQALFQYWNNKSYMNGADWWFWSSDPNEGHSGNQDFTPQHKPAQQVLTEWFTQGGTPDPDPDPDPDPEPPTGSWDASGSFTGSQVNNPIETSVTVTSSGSASNVIVDVEIYNSSDSQVFQQFFENQSISQSSPKTYTVNWTPTSEGTYTLKLGVFNNNWTTNHFWNNSVAQVNVGNGTTPPPPPPPDPEDPTDPEPPTGPAVTNIWWPSDGATVQGLQPFKAMLEGRSIDDYSMFWQVGGDQLNEMANSTEDYPHKESWVDLSSWNWNGTGPYNINFVSKDGSGNVISEQSVNITVVQ